MFYYVVLVVTAKKLTLDVQITSRKLIFIQLSQLTKCPLYVSPFFNSTNYNNKKVTSKNLQQKHLLPLGGFEQFLITIAATANKNRLKRVHFSLNIVFTIVFSF